METQQTDYDIEKVFRALSDLTRLRILNLLRGGELCVCDLIDVLDLPQSTVSRHLAYLRKVNLVKARKEGLWHYYQLVDTDVKFMRKVFECVEAASEAISLLHKDVKTLDSSCCQKGCE
ncbi:HTH-type transcriptional repressor CzrA [Polystyrenella longa]|uniref:HTH-type transcriptional repressor CzrA n=1 Tax=Polystyrenella longa TaxID=2528007 RepID=A0A518CJM6_9PLAN|nr:metalloregulator ArsR/SmtB family transcription factor [Polystyrenella longa]QDU79432.1 HTH-type transcriptional repressor CzrA [Polystyrenella longa]